MRISQDLNPNAILPADRKGPIGFDGSGTLLLSRNNHAIRLEAFGDPISVQFFSVASLRKPSRIGRFLQALPAVWRFCK